MSAISDRERASEIHVPDETLRMMAQAGVVLGPAELATLAQIDCFGSDDLPLLRERARRAVIAESEAAAMRRALDVWRITNIRLLLEDGLSVAHVRRLVARAEASLAEELPHVAAAHGFDVAAEIDRALRKGAS